MSTNKEFKANWSELLIEAVTKPGIISEAYRRFWNYSFGNQLLALIQCLERKIEPGPIHTFKGWRDLGRHVKKGENAITLCMPVTVKDKKLKDRLTAVDPNAPVHSKTIFVYRNHWFVLSQTDGEPYVPVPIPDWNEDLALQSLKIERTPFNSLDGNCQGFAVGRKVAVSPIAALPHKTLFHELAHALLGHTIEIGNLVDTDSTPRNLREVEAEAVALICCESLGLSGAPEARGYIQHWLGANQPIPEKSAQKIFRVADMILREGVLQRDC